MDHKWRRSPTYDYNEKVKIVKKGYQSNDEVRQGNY